MALCEVCEALDINKESRLGEYTELITRAEAGCDACRFYCDILQNSGSWSHRLDKLHGNIVFLRSQRLDVRKPDRIGGRSYSCDDLLFDYVVPEDYAGPKDEDTDIRRIIPSNPEDELCFKQLRSWLTECSQHKNCPKLHDVPLPPRIMQVSSKPGGACKVIDSKGKTGQYIILGDPFDQAEFSKFNSELHSGERIGLPKTIEDAITITQQLGYRYLWIPALCVEVYATGASHLESIYGNAALMISPTLESGIFGERKVFYSPALGKNKDRFMRQKLLRWDWDLSLHAGNSEKPRGWLALQHILAPRIVHYTKRQMIWECADGLKFEAAGIPDKKTGSGQVRQRYKKSFVQPLITSYLKQHSDLSSPGSSDTVERLGSRLLGALIASSSPRLLASRRSSDLKLSERLEAWHQTIDELSTHSFPTSQPNDKLRAIATVARILNPDDILGIYLSGIWTSNLAAGLAWGRVYPVLTAAKEYRAPSWSPLSVDGQTGSMFLNWPETILEDQKEEPHKTFISKYGPRLIAQDLRLVDPNNTFSAAQPGSSITVSGIGVGLMHLLNTTQSDTDRVFQPTFVLDKSRALDCSVCGHHEEQFSEKEREDEGKKVKDELEHHIALFVQGHFWGAGFGEGVVDCVVLTKLNHTHEVEGSKEVDEKREISDEKGESGEKGVKDVVGEEKEKEKRGGYERVGFLRLGLDFYEKPSYKKEDGSLDREFLERKFEGLGWEDRKSVV